MANAHSNQVEYGGELVSHNNPLLYHTHSWRPDVVKALCLGAKAVGLGRPFLYAQSVRAMELRRAAISETIHRHMELQE